jgi:hypothetical protein
MGRGRAEPRGQDNAVPEACGDPQRRDVLLREELLRNKDFWPVRLVAPPSDRDARGWQPEQVPPMYPDDGLAVMRRREANL